MSRRLIGLAAVAVTIAACSEPVSTKLQRELEGEWAFTMDVQYVGSSCPAAGKLVFDDAPTGALTPYEGECVIQAGEITNVVHSDTSAEFTFRGAGCNVSGRFVTADSIDGSLSCNVPFNFQGTFGAGRVGPAARVEIVPAVRGLAVGTTQRITAFVFDAQGHRLYGRVPAWSMANTPVASATPDSLFAEVHALSPGSATLTATYEGHTGSATIEVSAPAFVSLSAGGDFTCGFTMSGAAWCWGRNADGQLGDGSRISSLGPVRVQGSRAYSMLDAGYLHACAVSAGAAYCWGMNHMGQLGTGDRALRLEPAQVAGATQYVEVRAGTFHTCALAANAAAWCWGGGTHGVLGNGATLESRVPVAVAGGLSFRELAVGDAHSCGVSPAGAAYCWGMNQAGQLGNGGFQATSSPSAVVGELTLASITAGSQRSCALGSGGATYCWGLVHHGQYQIGADTVLRAPVAMNWSQSFSVIRSGSDHTCALDSEGAAWCWGRNHYGQLGDGSQTSRGSPVPVAGGLRFTSITAGGHHSCAITTDAVAYCWGWNSSGELGDGTTVDRATPVRVAGQP